MYKIYKLGYFVSNVRTAEEVKDFLANQPNLQDFAVAKTTRADLWLLENGT
jgi:hypothetical protein